MAPVLSNIRLHDCHSEQMHTKNDMPEFAEEGTANGSRQREPKEDDKS